MRHSSVLDQVGLGGGEDEFAVGDIDLAAAEVGGVQAFLHAGDDFLRIALAGEHVGVGHARHGDVREGLAPRVAGERHFHQARVQAVLQVAAQHAVFDQHVALGRGAFVVDRERAAPARQRAVVHHRDAGRSDALAEAS